MSAAAHLNHHIVDHLDRWSRTGCDGAWPDRCGMRRRVDQQSLPGIDVADAISLGACIVAARQLDQRQPRRRSASAAPAPIAESP